jgi:hypothetical protein
MAARTLVATTPALTGTSIVSASSALGTGDICTISCTTAQSSLDLSQTYIRATNANTITSVILTISVGTIYSEVGQGSASITLATADSIIIGGQGFESARFLQCTAKTVLVSATGTGPTTLECYVYPKATE